LAIRRIYTFTQAPTPFLLTSRIPALYSTKSLLSSRHLVPSTCRLPIEDAASSIAQPPLINPKARRPLIRYCKSNSGSRWISLAGISHPRSRTRPQNGQALFLEVKAALSSSFAISAQYGPSHVWQAVWGSLSSSLDNQALSSRFAPDIPGLRSDYNRSEGQLTARICPSDG
ncbi:hypothetical protein SCHPADRAFT_928109, partial [Schizopora paradoxa]